MASKSAVDAARRFLPLGGRVLVQRVKPMSQTAGGIVLPETAQTKLNEGIVLRVPKDDDSLSVKVNDKVMLSEYAGTDVKIDDEEFLLYREEDILGIIES
mmetsp:Transcript_6452/g.18293  ORF Transcript_6452/g.18293 Transcript_6452/m.18293 type:complete len:100 (-) Transcript_6452:123-422(-)|eukprot:CAMPEP_0119127354 /NCGR_PEP_ID=MMETSP1310-20130426/5944_1 /TAXON_ID=464262 /ORGANISM="Genus nov. species nov., Strain RCC2339" /LENGTH=99 /DNA_ID=CAMNT_0007117607 /DNA_START=73 /DNA_END=372 /DNA_ORIENTATION=+